MRALRLCIITREYPPFTRYSGGIGCQYAALAPELARQGHDVHVVSPARHRADFTHEGVTFHVVRWPRVPHLENVAWSMVVDARLRSLGRFDAVYAAEWGADAWRYSEHQQNGPLVTNLQVSQAQVLALSSGLPPAAAIRPRILIAQRLERRQSERSTGVVGCSRAVLDWARRLWRLESVPSVGVLPNTTSVARVRGLADGELADRYPPSGRIVAFAGRLETRKGVHVLAAAMRQVWQVLEDVHLVLLGSDYPYRGRMMSEHILKTAGEFGGRVHVLGHQAPETLFPAIVAADVVALPSLWEAFGIVALEAMALGKPVVLTTGSGYDEFATDGLDALKIAPHDERALADAVIQVLGDAPLRERLGAEAARTAERFDVRPVAEAHADFFASLGERRAG